MHSLLESYLAEVAGHLGVLPAKRRAEELREMRTHLENAVIVSRELGQSEEEAAQSAVAQFGAAQDLGAAITVAWRRGETRDRRSLLGAAACTLAVQFLGPIPLVLFAAAYFSPISPAHLPTAQSVILAINLAWCLGVPILAGAVSGVSFPKRAVAGTGIGTAACFCLDLAVGGYLLTHHEPVMIPASTATVVMNITGQSITGGIISLLSAWAISRWRNARTGRARLVRG